MRSKEFITELNMAPGNLLRFAFSSPIAKNMRAGFEAELIVPGDYTGDEDDGSGEFDWEQDRTLPRNVDMGDIADFFELNSRYTSSDRSYQELESAYMEWVDEQAGDSIEEDLPERIAYLQEEDPELDDDSAHDKAWDELHDEYYQGSLPDLYDFFRDSHLHTFSDVSNEYSFDWPYFTQGGIFEDEASPYAESLADSVDAMIQISSSYHGDTKEFSKGYWYIEPDTSIAPDESGYMGIEVVSPPMNIIDMLDRLQKTLEWAKSQGGKTNSSTGLHIGISMAGQTTENLDYIKLILFLGDKYILDRFGRAANTYTRSSLDILKKKVAYSGKEVNASILNQLRQGLALEASRDILTPGEDKSVSVHMKHDYIEFRSMGSDYLNHFDAIQNTILRYVRAFAVASDPMAERQEYFKKLSKIMNPSNNDQLVPFIRFAMGQYSKEGLLHSLKTRASQKSAKFAPRTDDLAPMTNLPQQQEPENVFHPNHPV